ncbi:MFS transporter [Nonomuraea sp. NPDC049714]|uniref:MFS transporter n=1 Tax=Nonomuraea sp. NPDC049714 TaxID=3364357 RepID=UPI00379D19E0
MTSDAAPVTTETPAPDRDRRRYLIASGVALWGAQLAVVAVPLTAVTELSVDARGTALLTATTAVAFMVLGLPVGAWLDRVRRRPVMITADLVRAATLATVPFADWLDALTFTHLWLVVAVNGIATVFFDLGTQSHLKDLAPADQLVRMNGRLATLTQTALICAPPLAGWAAGILTPAVVLAVTSAGYLWSATWLSRLRTPEPARARSAERRHIASDIRDGVVFVWRQPVLLTVLGSGCLVNFGIAAVTAVLPVYALDDLGWSPAQLGLYLGAGGVGGLAGAMTAERVARRLGVGPSLLVIGLVLCPVAALLPMTGSLVPGPIAALAWSLVLYKVGFDSVLMMSFRQAVTPSYLLGRVNGTMRVLLTGAVALGAGCAGAAAGVFGTSGSIIVAAVALGLAWVPVAVSPVSRMVALDGQS